MSQTLARAESRKGLWLSGPPVRKDVVKAHPDVREFYAASEGGKKGQEEEGKAIGKGDGDGKGKGKGGFTDRT